MLVSKKIIAFLIFGFAALGLLIGNIANCNTLRGHCAISNTSHVVACEDNIW